MVVVLLGILGAVLLPIHESHQRATEAGALVRELAAWLDEIAMAPEDMNQACTVTIRPGTGLTQGAAIASVLPASCSQSAQFTLPDSVRRSTRFDLAATQASWTYTRRGALTTESGPSASSTSTDIHVKVSANGQSPLICLRVVGSLGLMRFGSNNQTASLLENCAEWRRM